MKNHSTTRTVYILNIINILGFAVYIFVTEHYNINAYIKLGILIILMAFSIINLLKTIKKMYSSK